MLATVPISFEHMFPKNTVYGEAQVCCDLYLRSTPEKKGSLQLLILMLWS